MIRINSELQHSLSQKMADNGADDWTRLLKRFNDKVDRIGSTQMAQNSELSQLCSMQNRIIRDLLRLSTRVNSLERIAAYRTKDADDNDPIKQTSLLSSQSSDQK